MLQARKKIQKKELKKDPFFEKIDQGVRFYNSNKNFIYGSLIFILLVVAGLFVLNNKQTNAETASAASFGIAQQYLDQGDFDSAESRLNELLYTKADKKYKGLATYYLAYIAMNRQEYDAALPLFEKYLNEYHNQVLYNESALNAIARIEEGKGNLAKAADYFKKAADVSESYRKDFTFLNNAARCYILDNNLAEAEIIYNTLAGNKEIADDYSQELETLDDLLH